MDVSSNFHIRFMGFSKTITMIIYMGRALIYLVYLAHEEKTQYMNDAIKKKIPMSNALSQVELMQKLFSTC